MTEIETNETNCYVGFNFCHLIKKCVAICKTIIEANFRP